MEPISTRQQGFCIRLAVLVVVFTTLEYAAVGDWYYKPRPFANEQLQKGFYAAGYSAYSLPSPSVETVERAFVQACRQVAYAENEERRASYQLQSQDGGYQSTENTFSTVHSHNVFQAPNRLTRSIARQQRIFQEASSIVAYCNRIPRDQAQFVLSTTPIIGGQAESVRQFCANLTEVLDCEADRFYRTGDGSCNNLQNPRWGRASSCFERLLPSDYGDGLNSLRLSRAGRPLPNARTISLTLHSSEDRTTNVVSHMHMQFGQFLDHDITLTPFSRTVDNMDIPCCPLEQATHPQCASIELSRSDPFFTTLGQTCLNFVRSDLCSLCTLGPRQQTNQQTTFIDASQIYGLNDNETEELRSNSGDGTLRVTENFVSGPLLPISVDPNNDGCSMPDNQQFCFRAGDPRVNEQRGLTSMHTIFLRHHNRVARGLQRINPHWDDARLFQEARRIVGAQMQMIVYQEYLPPLLGERLMHYFRLWVKHHGTEYTEYEPEIQPVIVHEFATAAFRFGHSMIDSFFQEINGISNDTGHLLRNIFINPFELYNGGLEPLVRGLVDSPCQQSDRFMSVEVTNYLYKPVAGQRQGLDLAALNIQRGRDHGIPGYIQYVSYCGGPQIRDFHDLDALMPSETREMLEYLYDDVNDIDLFSGGLSETPREGAIVGPTFACIIGIQFYNLKYGDRFYFEHYGQRGSFSPAQLAEIRKTTLAKIICEVTDIYEIQPLAMAYDRKRNDKVPCRYLPDLHLDAWREGTDPSLS